MLILAPNARCKPSGGGTPAPVPKCTDYKTLGGERAKNSRHASITDSTQCGNACNDVAWMNNHTWNVQFCKCDCRMRGDPPSYSSRVLCNDEKGGCALKGTVGASVRHSGTAFAVAVALV